MSARTEAFGKLLGRAGVAGLPLAIGLAGGFWMADRGVPWLPAMLEVVLGVALLSLLAFPIGRALQGRAFAPSEEGLRLRKRVAAALILAVVAGAVRLGLWVAEKPSPLTRLSSRDFLTAFETDLARYREYDQGMERVVRAVEEDPAIAEAQGVLAPEAEARLLEAWRELSDYAFALDQVRAFHEDWWRFDPSRAGRASHVRSFLLTFAAELSLYEKAARFSAVVLRNPNAAKYLDTPHPELGIAADGFSRYRQELLGSRDGARVLAGAQYLSWLETALGARPEVEAAGLGALWRGVERNLRSVEKLSVLDKTTGGARADLQVLKRSVRRVWFPAQSSVAEWLGDTRVRRIGWYLITPAQIETMDPVLEPGDILLSRKNWYLSNVGLPGFWPHGLIYLGEPAKLAAFFDDPAVTEWARTVEPQATSFIDLLRRKWPAHVREYESGEHFRVMEAISEGVVFNSMEHAAGDYLAAFRPKLDKKARAQAIAEAFGHLSKPYDFDFDFATDHALVCTELVWRAYRPAEGKAGLDIPLVPLAGRLTLPANEIAALFARTRGTPSAQLDFVYFLDASEGRREAKVATEDDLAATWKRTKWDVALK